MFQAMAYLSIILTCLFIQIIQELSGDGLNAHVDLSITLKLSLKNRIRVPKICTEEICIKTAQEFLKYLDLDADPCDDFYKFSCGSFLKEKLPSDTQAESAFVDVHENLWSNMKNILEEPVNESDENIVQQIKLTYHSCMNSTTAEGEGLKAMKNILNDLGGWPLIEGDKWKESEQNLISILIRLQMCGMQGLFSLVLQKLDPSSEFPAPLVVRPELTLPDNYYEKKSKNEKMLNVLKRYIQNVGLNIGGIEKNDIIEKSVEEIVDFETELAECGRVDATLEERQEKFISLDKLKQKFEKVFDFEMLLKSIFKEVDIDIMANETIGIIDMPYMNCLSQLVHSTPKKNIVSYLIWRMVQNSIITLPKKFEEFYNTFQEKIQGTNTMRPRWKKCVALVKENFQQSLGYLYVKRFFKESTKRKVVDIVSNLKNAYARILSSKPWLSEETKVEALSKVVEMKEQIGYPDYFETLNISDSFSGLNLSGRTFMETFHLTKISRTKEILRKLRDPIDPKMMPMPIASTKKFYDLRMNRLVFPAGFVVSPFYSESYPMYINFGGIGAFIGHEITHGFDSFGSQFDKNGGFKRWWQKNDREMFASKSTCLMKQFNELILTETNQKVNGTLTIVENIADAGGLRIAYTAYKDWLRRYGEEKQLPGIPYTSAQMFFIAYARNFCEKLSDELARKGIETDPHSPSKFRVNMPLKNMKVFSKVFKCKANSTMNPFDRCRIW